MNPNETQGPGQPGHNETPLNAGQAAPQQPQQQTALSMGQPQPAPAYAQQQAPMPPHAAPQRPQAAPAPNRAGFAESLGSQHVQIGARKIDYASIVTLVGAVLSIIAVFLNFVTVQIPSFGYRVSTSLIGQGAVGWYMLVMLVVIGVCAVMEKRFTALVLTVLDTLLAIFVIAFEAHEVQEFLPTNSSSYMALEDLIGTNPVQVKYGVGMWLVLIGIIVMLIGTIVSFYNEQQAKKPATPAQPAGPDPYQNNGWQFGVPAPGQPSTTDNSHWQFGVPAQGQPAPTPAEMHAPFTAPAPAAPQQAATAVPPQAPAAPAAPAPSHDQSR